MRRRVRRSLAFCALALLASAAAAADAQTPSSVTVNFEPPNGWTQRPMPSRAGAWASWTIDDGGVQHSIVLSITPTNAPALRYGPASVEQMRALPGVTILQAGPTTACGDVPAYGFTYRSDRTAGHPLVIRHLVVDIGSLLGDVSYAHPPDIADRADAVDALSTFCDRRVYAPRAPAGWRSIAFAASGRPGVAAFMAPDGKSSLIALAARAPASKAAEAARPAELAAGATMIRDAQEPCGSGSVRRTTFATGSGADAKINEQVAGYRHGTNYVYVYVRPASATAEPDAERALTAFCEAGATLATPPPDVASPAPATSVTPSR